MWHFCAPQQKGYGKQHRANEPRPNVQKGTGDSPHLCCMPACERLWPLVYLAMHPVGYLYSCSRGVRASVFAKCAFDGLCGAGSCGLRFIHKLALIMNWAKP